MSIPQIILIENDHLDLDDELKALSRFNCAVEVFDKGFACNKGYWESLPGDRVPAVVIVNLHISPYSCINILKDLRASTGTKTVPVIVLTHSVVEKHVLEPFRFGNYTCVVKPLSYVKLLYAFTTLKANRELLRPA